MSDHPSMVLRGLTRLDRGDAERFVGLAAFPPWHRPAVEEMADARVARWLSGWGDELGVGAETAGTLVGAAWARALEPVLLRDPDGKPFPELIIAVDEPFRGQGVGRQLIRELQQLVANRDHPGLVLTVSDRNETASHLYRESGFIERSRTETGQLVMAWRPAVAD